MVSKKKSEWPPPGWKVEIKVTFNGRHYKCYINSKTGEKLYSKHAVLQCIKKGERSSRESQSRGTKQHPMTKTGNKKMHLLEANDSLNLPPGWTLEWKVRQSGAKKGTKYKCIIDRSSGSKFYSMPEVYRYLKSRKGSAGSSKQAKRESITNSKNNCYSNSKRGKKFYSKLAVLRCIRKGKRSNRESQSRGKKQQPKTKNGNKKLHLLEANDSLNLPPGWTLEWKVRQSGAQKGIKYKCITDPSTGSKFYSMPEVYRYLKSRKGSAGSSKQIKGESITNSKNNTSVNPMSPRQPNLKKELPEDSEPIIHDKLSSGKMKRTPSGNIEKTRKGTKRKHFTDGKSPEQSVLVPLVVAGSNEAQSKRITRSSLKIQSVSSGLEQICLLPGPAKTVHEMVPAQPGGEISAVQAQIKRITRSYSKVQSVTTCEPSLEQIPSLPEPAMTVKETLPAKADGQVSSAGAQGKRKTRSSSKVQSASTCEPSIKQILLLRKPAKTPQEMVPVKPNREIFAVEAKSKRSTRSSSKVESSPICEPNLEKIPLLPEPGKTAQEMVPAKPDEVLPVGAQSKRRTTPTKVHSAYFCEPSLEQSPLLPEPAQGFQETVPAKRDGEVPSMGAQSKRRTRSTSKVQSAYICGPSLEQTPLLPETQETVPAKPDGELPSVGAQSKKRTGSSSQLQSASTCGPSLEQISLEPEPDQGDQEMVPAKLNGAVFAVQEIDDVRPDVRVANVKQNNVVPKETGPSTLLKHTSDVKLQGSCVRKTPVNKNTIKDRKVSNLSSCSSKKLAVVEPEVVLHSIPIERAHLSTENSSKTNEIPSSDLVPNEPQQRAQSLDDDRQNVLTSQQQISWAFDINTPTVLQTQIDSLEKIDYIPQEYIEEIFLQEDEGPPGFSQYPRATITQSTIDQLFEDSFDTMPEDMIEKSPEKHKIPEEQQDTPSRVKIDESSGNCSVLEEPTTQGRNNEQPESQFGLPSPLWSDPCLEFAFKTLTGALPLDDNVVIQDFMEHQFRTCDQVNNQRTPDVGMSSFCQNNETKVSPPLPDDVGFTTANGFNSHKPNR